MNEDIAAACCFTGHRPHKAGLTQKEEGLLSLRLTEEIALLYRQGVHTFYTGMARGADMFCAERVLELRRERPDMRLTAVIPYRGQQSAWPDEDKRRYEALLAYADRRVFLKEAYAMGCFQERNRYMVEHAAHVLAVFNGAPGGTADTLRYAKKLGREIIRIDPRRLLEPMQEKLIP